MREAEQHFLAMIDFNLGVDDHAYVRWVEYLECDIVHFTMRERERQIYKLLWCLSMTRDSLTKTLINDQAWNLMSQSLQHPILIEKISMLRNMTCRYAIYNELE